MLLRWRSGKKKSTCRCSGLDSWVEKIFWSRKWQPTPLFLPGKSHGQRSLVGYSPWGRRVGLCCQPKPWPSPPTKGKIWGQRLEEIERWLLFSAGEEGNTVGSPSRTILLFHEEPRGLYRQGLTVWSQWWGTEGDKTWISSSFIVSKTVINWHL